MAKPLDVLKELEDPGLTYMKDGLQYAQPTLPDLNPGLISATGRLAGGALATAGNLLDLPGSSIRDTISLHNPLDQWLDPLGYKADTNRMSGRQVGRQFGLIGDEDNWGNFAGGMAAEIALDPLTYLTAGGTSLTKGGKLVAKTGHASKAKSIANKLAKQSAEKQGKRLTKEISTWGARSKITPQMIVDNLTDEDKVEFLENWAQNTGKSFDEASDKIKNTPLQSGLGLQMNFPFVRGALRKLGLTKKDDVFWGDQSLNLLTVKDPQGALDRWAAKHGEDLGLDPGDLSGTATPPSGGPNQPPGSPGTTALSIIPENTSLLKGNTSSGGKPGTAASELAKKLTSLRQTMKDFDQVLADTDVELADQLSGLNTKAHQGWRPSATNPVIRRAYQPIRTLAEFREHAKTSFNLTDDQADVATSILEARASTWADTTGRSIDEYFGSQLEGLSGPDDPFSRGILDGLGDDQLNKGFAKYADDTGTIIGGFAKADFSTVVHELAHVFNRDMERLAKNVPEVANDLAILAKRYGDKAGAFSKKGREMFARDVERYVRDGKAPTKELEGAFALARKWMVNIYKRLTGSEIEKSLTPEVRDVFDRMLGSGSPRNVASESPRNVGGDNFISGMQSGTSDVRANNITNRPVGISVQPRKVSKRVIGQIINQASQGKDVFIDSGIATTVKQGKAPDFPKAFEAYQEILDKTRPANRSRLMFVMPDHLQLLEDGSIMGDQAKTLELQYQFADQIRNLQDSGATVIVPIQRGEMGLSEAASMATDVVDFTNGRTAYGLPYNKGKWDDESILDLARNIAGSRAHFHMLGGGAKRVDAIREQIHKIDPDIRVTGDAATEVRNRPKKADLTPPAPAVREAADRITPPSPATRLSSLSDDDLRKLNKDGYVQVDGETITDLPGEALDEIYRRMDLEQEAKVAEGAANSPTPPPPAIRAGQDAVESVAPEAPVSTASDLADDVEYEDVSYPTSIRYQDVKVGELKTWDELNAARNAIESHPDNVVGGLKAWDSGQATELKPAAQRKVAQLEARMSKIAEAEDAAEEIADAAPTVAPTSSAADPVAPVSNAVQGDAAIARYVKDAAKRYKSKKEKISISGVDGKESVTIQGVSATRVGDSPFAVVSPKNIEQAVATIKDNRGTATGGLYHIPSGLRIAESGSVADFKSLVAMFDDAGIDLSKVTSKNDLGSIDTDKVGKIIRAWETDQWSELPDDVRNSFKIPESSVPPANFVIDGEVLAHRKMARFAPDIQRVVRAIAKESPEFTVNPVFTVAKDGMLKYGSIRLDPGKFLPSNVKLKPGQTVAVDLMDFNIKPLGGTQDALAANLRNAGFKVKKSDDAIDVTLGDKKAKVERGGNVVGEDAAFVRQVSDTVRRNIADSGGTVDFQGQKFFSDDAIRKAKEETGYKSRSILIELTPQEFLRLASSGVSGDKTSVVEGVLNSGGQFSSVPRLTIDKGGRVVGHEGRHRSRALAAAGVDKIPVLLESSNIRWSEQAKPGSFDYLEDIPTKILPEDGGARGVDLPVHLSGPMRGQPLSDDIDFQGALPNADDPAKVGKKMLDGSINDTSMGAYQEAVELAKSIKDVTKAAPEKLDKIKAAVMNTDPAEIASNAMDAIANFWYKLPFGQELTAMVDDRVHGATSPDGRLVGNILFETYEQSNINMRNNIMPIALELHRTGYFDKDALLRSGMDSKEAVSLLNKRNNWMLDYIEEVDSAADPKSLGIAKVAEVKHQLDAIKEILRKQLEIEQAAGINISNLTDILIKYFPRIKKAPGKSYRFNPDAGQALSAALENAKRRELVDIPGGTSVLNEISIDPFLSGVIERNPVIRRKLESGQLAELRQHVAENYGERVSLEFDPKKFDPEKHTYFDKVIKWAAGLDPEYQEQGIQAFGGNIIQDLMERLEHGNRAAIQLRGAQNLFAAHAIRNSVGATKKHQTWNMDKALDEINANTDQSYLNILEGMDAKYKAEADEHVINYADELAEQARASSDPEDMTAGSVKVKHHGTEHTVYESDSGFVDKWERTQKFQGDRDNPVFYRRTKKDTYLVGIDEVLEELGNLGYDTKNVSSAKAIRKLIRQAKKDDKAVSFRELKHNKIAPLRVVEHRVFGEDELYDHMRELARPAAIRDFLNNANGGFGIDRRIGNDVARWLKPFQLPDEVDAVWKAMGRATNIMRAGLTGPFPAFHFRNLISGQFTNATYGATDPRYMGPKAIVQPILDAYAVRSGAIPKGLEDIYKGKSPREAYEQLQKEIFDHNLIGDRMGRASEHIGDDLSRVTSQIVGVNAEINPLKALKSLMRLNFKEAAKHMSPIPPTASFSDLVNPLAGKGGVGYNPGKGIVTEYGEEMFLPYVYGRDMGSFVEDLNRIAPYLAYRRQGFSAKAAADKVKKIQVDYSRLTATERNRLRAIFPFYTFSSRMIPLTFNEILTNPGGRTATTIKTIHDLQNPDEVAPDYITETAAIPLGKLSDGSNRYLTGFGLAFEDALNLTNGAMQLDAEEGLRELASRSSPFVKAPIEWMTQESLFHRSPDGGRDLADLDPVVGRTIANVKDLVTGSKTERAEPFISDGFEFLVANSPLSRAASTARTLTDSRKWESPTGLANLLTGVRVSDVSPTAQDAILQQRAAKMLKDLGGREYKRAYVPEDRLDRMSQEDRELAGDLQQLLKDIDSRFKERREKRNKLQEAAK